MQPIAFDGGMWGLVRLPGTGCARRERKPAVAAQELHPGIGFRPHFAGGESFYLRPPRLSGNAQPRRGTALKRDD
ncbi:hypothetical protein PT2222_10255 [Paraburkholderia tropica]